MYSILIMKFQLQVKQNLDEPSDLKNLLKTATMSMDEHHPPVTFQLPCSYGGPKGENNQPVHYTPEHLYLGAVAGCFFTTFNVISTNSNLTYESLNIDIDGTIEVVDGVKMMTEITQKIILRISNPDSETKAMKILKKTEKYCPLANSVKTTIINHYIIEIDQ